MRACFYRRTTLGMIRIEERDERIVRVDFEQEFPEDEECEVAETACLWQAFTQLQEYLEGKRQTFELILHPEGTEFQKAAWQALMEIPYGETSTYGALADQLRAQGISAAAQAVGGAVGHNPISIIVPCHRVVGTDGSLTGYAGGIDKKIKLLEYEHMDVEQFYVPKKGTICKNKTIG